MMPEPKNYKSWRKHMLHIEESTKNGTFEEIWNPGSGRVFRFSGQPHPDGALALMLEDIGDEVSLNRGFRQELETFQAVFDRQDNAIVVFSPERKIGMTNAAYVSLWGVDPDTAFCETGFDDALSCWQASCAPSLLWQKIEKAVYSTARSKKYSGTITLKSGKTLTCRFTGLPGGSTLVEFASQVSTPELQNEKTLQ
jgi:PAS domain-containing protein